ncbi:MAG: Gfo/Idh/MocA family oxidoreductase [Terriglobia bacterium]|jgi:predicted dehydrogenase
MTDEKREEGKRDFNRRTFIGAVAAVGAGAVLASCNKSYPPVKFVDQAADGPVLKVGLVGCGNRGTGATLNILDAGPNIKIVALADVLKDHMDTCRANLAKKAKVQVDDDHCFIGFDAYKKVLDSDVDVVLLATPPHFRPQQFEATVDAKKHCFMEKPGAVDAPGVRSIMASGQKATAYKLCVVAGTLWRHDRPHRETYNRVSNGAIGKIIAARSRYNVGQLWYTPRRKGWSDMEAMIRDWLNWCWLSGDHIVEQCVHNIDTVLWFTGMHPTYAVGDGGRARRVTGDQYDHFNIQYAYPNGGVNDTMCRQIDGCANEVSDLVLGTEGSTNCKDTIYDLDGKVVWKYQEEGQAPGKTKFNPYVQEHIDFVNAIRTNQPVNETEHVAYSTLTAILGRESAYTGKKIMWDEMMDSKERLGPTEYAMGPVDIKAVVPVPGTAANIAKHVRTA